MADLHSEYREFLRRAAEVGLTRPTGLTPREHEGLLHRSEVLPREEVTALRELIEDDVYGSGHRRTAEGLELIRGLMERMRALPVVAPAPEERIETDTPLGSSRLPRILPWVIGVLVVVLLLVAPKGVATAVSGGGGGAGSGGGRGGTVRGITPVDASREFEAVRAATGNWRRGIPDPTIETVVVPEYQNESGVEGTFGFDTATGIDHEFL